ncbi:DMT family transporter [Rhodovulum sp. DZ06]|uniref:DMT family transporter n=1 Tax=Rhodovulum sp. DZ06 TaxID=3425126 RepID=UPI003D354EDB
MTAASPDADRRDDLVGAAWMTAAMAGFAVEDALLKAAAATLPVAQVMLLFGLFGGAAFLVVLIRRGLPPAPPEVASRPMLLRFGAELAGRLFYTLALALIPLSTVTAILQATPLVVVAGAAWLFRERVGPRRWAAIGAGLVGVLLILRPGGESFSAATLIAVAGMLGFAGRDLASRAAPRSLHWAHLGFWGFATIMAAGAVYGLAWERAAPVLPPLADLARIGGAAAAGVFAYAALMTAMRTGAVAAVTPFRYTRLLFGIGLGALLFAERPDPLMLLGCAVVVASGLLALSPRRR